MTRDTETMGCPLEYEGVCDVCDYCKETLCDYPFIGGDEVPNMELKLGLKLNLAERVRKQVN